MSLSRKTPLRRTVFQAKGNSARKPPVRSSMPGQGGSSDLPETPARGGKARQRPVLQTRIGIARRAKKKRTKLPSLKNLKKRVWVQFSIFIRTRNADESGMVSCVTCPARHLWNSGEIHAGHWIHGRLDFNERNIHPQCRTCNYYWRTSVSAAYACFMARTYGPEVMDDLRLLSNTKSKSNRAELNQLLDHYSALNKINPLAQEKC